MSLRKYGPVSPPDRGIKGLLLDVIRGRRPVSVLLDNRLGDPDRRVREAENIRSGMDEYEKNRIIRAMSEFRRAQAAMRDLRSGVGPPEYTMETAPLMSEEEIASWGVRRGMNRGGMIPSYANGGQADQMGQTVQETFVSPEVAPIYANLTDRIAAEGMRPYQPYGGQRLAGFTDPEMTAMRGIYQYGIGGGPAAMGSAEQALMGAMSGYGGVGYQSTPGALDPYMSQYTQGVVDPQVRDIRREAERQQQSLMGRAGMAGAAGGYRHGLGEQGIRMQAAEQIGDVRALGRQQAFESAQQAFDRDRAARMAAAQGLYGVGGGLASLGGQQQSMQYERLGQMMGAGQQARQLQQQSMDIGYQDWQNRMNQARQNIGWQLGAMSQLPYQSTTMTTEAESQARPPAAQRYLGTAIGALGLYNAYPRSTPPTLPQGATTSTPGGTIFNPGGTQLFNPGDLGKYWGNRPSLPSGLDDPSMRTG